MNRRSFLLGLLAATLTRFLPKPQPPTLLDVAKWRCYGNRGLLPVVEALSQKNPLLQDMVWKEPAPTGLKYMGIPIYLDPCIAGTEIIIR